MKATRTCQHCGAKFLAERPNKIYCSYKCAHNAGRRRERTSMIRAAEHALAMSKPVTNLHIMTATRKPENTSAVRWRMELRRRANPERYAYAGGAW